MLKQTSAPKKCVLMNLGVLTVFIIGAFCGGGKAMLLQFSRSCVYHPCLIMRRTVWIAASTFASDGTWRRVVQLFVAAVSTKDCIESHVCALTVIQTAKALCV